MKRKTHSLRKAINEKCKDCIYDPLSGLGTWRQQVECCTSHDCPLYPVRPISKPEIGRKRGQEGLISEQEGVSE